MEAGLEDVIAARTVLSDVDGQAGRLIIRGASLDSLVGVESFESVCARLWAGFSPDLPADLPAALGRARAEVWREVDDLDDRLAALPPVEALRGLMARLADGEDTATALRVVAAPAVFTGAVLRRAQGLAPVHPDPGSGHAADLLRMISGAPPTPAQAATLDAYLVTVIDHGLNASTFAARVAASTRAGLVSAALAGLSAIVTAFAQLACGAVSDFTLLPFDKRLGNAIYSYAFYLVKSLWPSDLAILYVYPASYPAFTLRGGPEIQSQR